MKRFVFLLAVLVAMLLPVAATANNGHHHHSTVDPTFTCDGVNCTYTATGLAALTSYQASFEYAPSNPALYGCNTGYGNWQTNAAGTFTLTDSEDWLVGCNGLAASFLPGTMTVWLRPASSTDFNDPAVTGTLITVSVT